MQIDAFVFHLIVAIVPGYVSFVVFRHIKIVGKSDSNQKDWISFLSIFIFSIIDIIILQFFHYVYEDCHGYLHTDITKNLYDPNSFFSFIDLMYLIIIGLFVGMIAAQLYNKKIIYKLAKFLSISVSYGEEDVWTMTVGAEEIDWVYVRDHDLEKVYFGHIEKYSDTNAERELTLSQVTVFDNISGKELYSAPRLYICRDKYKLTIEQVESGGNNNAAKPQSATSIKRRIGKERWYKSGSEHTKARHKTHATRAKAKIETQDLHLRDTSRIVDKGL